MQESRRLRAMHQALNADWWLAGVCLGGTIVGLVAIVAARLLRSRPDNGANLGGDEFSLARYEPIVRLVGEEDLEFLARQPGCRPEILAKLRRERRKILRMYLRELAADFRSLHRQARWMAT